MWKQKRQSKKFVAALPKFQEDKTEKEQNFKKNSKNVIRIKS